MTREPYARSFFERPPDAVAHDLIGSHMVIRADDRTVHARIIETEAYGGRDDLASHAYRGPTPRCTVMFGPAGFLYVYRSYGIHWCMNVVSEKSGRASAVLLRAATICAFSEDCLATGTDSLVLRGPGNLTRGLGITGSDNGEDCCSESGGRVAFHDPINDEGTNDVARSGRIGISKEQERLSRYFLKGHPAVSRLRTAPASRN